MRRAAEENTGKRRADLASIEGCSSPASRKYCLMRNARYAAELVVTVDTTAKANVLANSVRSMFVAILKSSYTVSSDAVERKRETKTRAPPGKC